MRQRVRVTKVGLAACSERGTELGWGSWSQEPRSHGVGLGVWGAAGEGAPPTQPCLALLAERQGRMYSGCGRGWCEPRRAGLSGVGLALNDRY